MFGIMEMLCSYSIVALNLYLPTATENNPQLYNQDRHIPDLAGLLTNICDGFNMPKAEAEIDSSKTPDAIPLGIYYCFLVSIVIFLNLSSILELLTGSMNSEHVKVRVVLEHDTFTPGMTLNGNVAIYLDKQVKIEYIEVVVHGVAITYIGEKNKNDLIETKGREVYLNEEITLLKDKDGLIEHAGSHHFPFSTKLPESIPCSFKDKDGIGKVKYYCLVLIRRHHGLTMNYTKEFTVHRPYSLSKIPKAEEAVDMHREKTANGCCCSRGSLDIHLKMNRSGFVPGEEMEYDINVTNNSGLTIKKMHFALRKIIKFKGLHHEDPVVHDHKVSDMSDSEFNCRSTEKASIKGSYLVPNLPASGLEGCSIIDIMYYVQLVISFKWFVCNSVELDHEIWIGTKHMADPRPNSAFRKLVEEARLRAALNK